MILPTFLREYEGVPDRLRKARESSDYQEIRGLAHKLKGVCPYLGADALLAQAGALEWRIREEATALAEEIDRFCEAVQAALDAVRQLL